MAEKYDKAAHAARLIKELGALGIEVTVGKPASTKAKTTTPLVSQRVGKAYVPEMKTSPNAPTKVPAGQTYKDPGRYNPFPNRGASRPPVGPPAQSGYSPLPGGSPMSRPIPTTWPNGAPRTAGPLAGAGQLPNSPMRPGMSMGPQEWHPPMVGGPPGMAAPTYANPLIDNQDEAWPTEQPNQQAWNPMALWSMLTGR
jgi:hypothetical protein